MTVLRYFFSLVVHYKLSNFNGTISTKNVYRRKSTLKCTLYFDATLAFIAVEDKGAEGEGVLALGINIRAKLKLFRHSICQFRPKFLVKTNFLETHL